MALDLNKLREKHEELNKTNNTDFDNLYVQIKEGTNLVRILPGKDDDTLFYAETAIHRVVDEEGNKKNIHCREIHGETCPLCDANKALWKKHNALKLAKNEKSEFSEKARPIKAAKRYYMNVIDRDDENKIKILSVGVKVFQKIVAKMLDEDYGDITDLETGFDYKIIKKMQGEFPEYSLSEPRPKSTPAGTKKEIAAYMESLHDIHALVKLEDYETVKKIAELYDPMEKPVRETQESEPVSEENFTDDIEG